MSASERDHELIALHYPRTGTRELVKLLPHMSRKAIRAAAGNRGIKYLPNRRNTLASEWPAEADAYLKKHYWKIRLRNGRMTKAAIGRALGKSPYQVSRRAAELGLVRHGVKQPEWTDEQAEFLADHVGRSSEWIRAAMVRRGWPARSVSGIASKRKKMGITVNGNGSIYSASELARLLGASNRAVCAWIRDGLLKAKPRTAAIDSRHGGVGDRWEIRPHEARNFIFKHPAYIDLGAVDKYWFLSIMEPMHQPRPMLMQASCGVEAMDP